MLNPTCSWWHKLPPGVEAYSYLNPAYKRCRPLKLSQSFIPRAASGGEIAGLRSFSREVTKFVIFGISVSLLQEVRLVYREGVRFLANCKAKGIKLKNCPAYIRGCLG